LRGLDDAHAREGRINNQMKKKGDLSAEEKIIRLSKPSGGKRGY